MLNSKIEERFNHWSKKTNISIPFHLMSKNSVNANLLEYLTSIHYNQGVVKVIPEMIEDERNIFEVSEEDFVDVNLLMALFAHKYHEETDRLQDGMFSAMVDKEAMETFITNQFSLLEKIWIDVLDTLDGQQKTVADKMKVFSLNEHQKSYDELRSTFVAEKSE